MIKASLAPILPMSSGFARPVQPQSTRLVIVQATALSKRLQACFATFEDPQVERTHLHLLQDIVTIAILSVLAGGEGWEDVELYGTSKQTWLSILALPNSIPNENTLAVYPPKVLKLRLPFVSLGELKMDCIGSWMSPLVKMPLGCVRAMPLIICPCYAALLSMHSIALRVNKV